MAKRYVSKEKLEELKKELDYLKTVKRKEIAELLRHTASFGDLSENFAYQQAREEQMFLERRIKELENIIGQCQVVDASSHNKIRVGSKITLKIISSSPAKEEVFQIVDPLEVDPFQNKISFNSPLGKELLGKGVGEKIKIKTARGTLEYIILKVE